MKNAIKIIFLGVLINVFMASCSLFFLPLKAKMGTIRVTLESPLSKTVVPFENEEGMKIASYQVGFTAPDGSLESLDAGTDGLVEKQNAIEGSWRIDVAALNSQGQVLGRGSGSVEVQPQKIHTLKIEIKPSGVGTVRLVIDWSANPLVEESYVAKAFFLAQDETLTPLEMTFDVDGKRASWASSAVQSGSREVLVRLEDAAGKVLWGKRETFLIYENLTSEKLFVIEAGEMNRKPEAVPEIGAVERAPNKIAINWTCASPRVETYSIEKKTEPDGAWEFVQSVQFNILRYVDSAVEQGGLYSYRVKAGNSFGETGFSVERQVSVPTVVSVTGYDNRIKVDTEWTSENTYEVENLQIEPGATLTIQPGVRVIFRINDLPGSEPYYLVVRGTLKVLGTKEEPVVFTTISSSPTVGSWSNIRFADESIDATVDSDGNYTGGSILQNCILEYTKGLNIVDSAPYIDGLTLRTAENLSISGSAGLGKKQWIKNLKIEGTNEGSFSHTANHALVIRGMVANTWRNYSFQGNVDIQDVNIAHNNYYGEGGEFFLNGEGIIKDFRISKSGKNVFIDGKYSFERANISYIDGIHLRSGVQSFIDCDFSNIWSGINISGYTKVRIEDSRFLGNGTRNLDINNSELTVLRSTFDGAATGISIGENTKGEIAFNTIKNASTCALSITNPGILEIHHNNVLNNAPGNYAISVTNGTTVKFVGNNLVNPKALREVKLSGIDDFWAGSNWWGTTVKSVIDSRIQDGNDTFYDGVVGYDLPMQRSVRTEDIFALPVGKVVKENYGTKSVLAWTARGGDPDSYRIQVDDDMTFTVPIIDETTSDTTKVLENLEWGKKYYWRVAAIKAGLDTVFGPTNTNIVTKLRFSTYHYAAMGRSDEGSVYFWGNTSYYGAIGPYPIRNNMREFVDINLSYYAKSLALKSDGSFWVWGSGEHGQLGLGDTNPRYSPIKLNLPSRVKNFDGGVNSSFAILEDGTLYGWGNNDWNQVTSTTLDHQWQPVKITGLPALQQISIDGYHLLALDENNEVWAWGMNSNYQCGVEVSANQRQSTPIKIVLPEKIAKVAAGYNYSLALGLSGTLYCWGYTGFSSGPNPYPITAQSKIIEIAAGESHFLAIDEDGLLYSAGNNGNGQLGFGDTVSRGFTQVPMSRPVYSIGVNTYNSYAVDINGRVWAWGYNGNQTVGDGTTTSRYSPVEIFMP